ncbi:Uma2 family endonuclease [soil metagenome]
MVVATTMSAAEYLATPEDRHQELIRGEVVVSEPTLPHGHVQTELLFRVRTWIEEAPGRGYVSTPADIEMDGHNVFAPDLWWVTEDRRPAPAQLLLDGQPDLVVEIRSPSTWIRDLGVKLPAYEASGVAEAWYVDTKARTVLVFRRSDPESPTFDTRFEVSAEETLTSPLLPGFALEVGTIFGR